MTKAEWLTCEDPQQMLDLFNCKTSSRKLRLFALEYCRKIPSCCESEEDCEAARRAIDALDRWAEELLSTDDLVAFGKKIEWFMGPRRDSKQGLACLYLATEHRFIASSAKQFCNLAASFVSAASLQKQVLKKSYKTIDDYRIALHPYTTLEKRSQQMHLRDIFGNPFRPVTFPPEWRTSTTVAIAEQMYESRDFGAMPILADALQDAGCDSADVLDHCRGTGPHVRGCWVVDLVLGKE